MHFALLGAMFYGVYYLIYDWELKRASFFTILFWGSIITTLLTAPFALKSKIDTELIKVIAIDRIVLLGAFYCFYLSVKKVGVSTAATFESMYPLFVVLFAAIYFKNVPSPSFIVGALLIFIGGAIISYFN
jgi:hypothetical protein